MKRGKWSRQQSSIFAVLLTCAVLFATTEPHAWAQRMPLRRLPSRAVLHLGTTWKGEDVEPIEQRACLRVQRLSAEQVRHQFATWHEISGLEFDLGSYVYIECGRSGTLDLDGKTYTWSVQAEDSMTTSWPDGNVHWYVRKLLKDDD